MNDMTFAAINDVQLAAIVIALVGTFRARRPDAKGVYAPRFEGNAVPLVAAVLGGLLSALRGSAPSWLAFAHGVGIGLTAVGAMTALKYAGEKLGVALVLALGPSRSKDADGPRG